MNDAKQTQNGRSSLVMTDSIIARLVDIYGWRFSNLNAKKAGVPEHILFDAVTKGKAKIEHTSIVTTVSTYLIFA